MRSKIVSLNVGGTSISIMGFIRNMRKFPYMDNFYNIYNLLLPTKVVFPSGHDDEKVVFSHEDNKTLINFLQSRRGKVFIRRLNEIAINNGYDNPRLEIVNLPQGLVYKPEQGTIAITLKELLDDIPSKVKLASLLVDIENEASKFNGDGFCMYYYKERVAGVYRKKEPKELVLLSQVNTPNIEIEQSNNNGVVTFNGISDIYVDGRVLQLRYFVSHPESYSSFLEGDNKGKFIKILMERFNSEGGRAFLEYLKSSNLDYIAFYPDADGKEVFPSQMGHGRLNITVTAFLSLSWEELRDGIESIKQQIASSLPRIDIEKPAISLLDRVNMVLGYNYNNIMVYPKDGEIIFEKDW